MGSFLNQNSFLLLVLILWLTAAGVLLRRDRNRRQIILLGAVTVVLAAGFSLLRPAPVSDVTAAAIKAQIGAGKPVLLQFRSQN
ncbi:MAG: hypothetical protein JW757_00505 [Anaerolineales bacterium]|nr:hypothetical protein [Anaerolineales bacterium]